jgi:response regulator RpfG family c-di-GMP phosphodiesterase
VATANSELVRALAELLDQSSSGLKRTREGRSDRRQVLVCAAESRRERIARRLAENDYQVFVAENTRQAVERMRENQLEIVLLDPDFDPAEQGAAFVTREVNVLRPSQRRRLFFGLLSPSLRTLDAHAAFLNNANIILNLHDLEDLPSVLDDALREYNALYSDFFQALNVPAL